jgi:hypothetical protein
MSKIMYVYGKVSDMCCLSIYDSEDKNYILGDYEGYVPKGSCIGRGDDIQFAVNMETGQILNWKNPLKNNEFCEQLDLILEE